MNRLAIICLCSALLAVEAHAEPDSERAARHARIAERRAGPAVIVHRGAWAFAPENSLAAYAAAMDCGADGCEVDIRRTRDGVLVLFHDDMLDRLTYGSGSVNELTHRELLALRPRQQFGRTLYSGAPTFTELLTLARQRAMLLHLDVKEPGLEDDVTRQLDDADMWEHVVSINTYNTARLRQHPKVKLLKYKGPGLFGQRRDVAPDAVQAQLARPGEMIIVDDPRVAAQILKRQPNRSARPVEPVSQVPVVTESVADLIAAFRRKESSPLADYRAKMHILPALGELRCAESKQFLLEYVAGAHDRPQFEDATQALLCQQLTDAELVAVLRSTNSAVRGSAILECVDRPTAQRRRALQTAAPWALELPSAAISGYITFAVNVHDWSHLEESAATVLRLIGIFEKHKVRGDFYFTPQIVEHYAQKRPDVIGRLKQSGMGICYHVRPPHPTYAGFEGRLRNLDDNALAQTLRDYETYRLDPATGNLQRDKPGGYSYVTQIFGRKPVVVSPQARDPRIRAAALKVYAEMGAKMVVAYHESGTKLAQPFEWINGLLARPSDFSITRWPAPGGREESFWWSMLDTSRAAEFNPATRLKSQLAAWHGSRAPFITTLIHENDFSREGGPGWTGIYHTGRGSGRRPKQPPFDLHAPDLSRPRTAESREKIWKAYDELVAFAAGTLRVVTSEDIVKLALAAKR